MKRVSYPSTGRNIIRGLLLSLILTYSFSDAVFAEKAAEVPPVQVFEDSLLPGALHSVGAPINGIALTEGGVKWAAVGKEVTITENGATSSSPGGAHHLIPSVAGTIRIQADVNAQGSGFSGIALGRGDLSGNFWANLTMIFFVNGGSYNLMVGTKYLIPSPDAELLHTGSSNQMELLVDTISRTVTARLNGVLVLDSVSLPTTAQLSGITAAGFRFNEPLTAGIPSVSHYRAEIVSKGSTGFEPVDLGMCFVVPDKEATLSWRVNGVGPTNKVPYIIADYEGRQIGSGVASLSAEHTVTIAKSFACGYSEIIFPEAGQTFGIVAMEPHTSAADPFFCMDAGLSWLESNNDRRAALVKILARCGIAMARERLGVANINPSRGKFDWEGGHQFDSVRKMYADSNVPILEILDGKPELPEIAESFVEMAKHWKVWGAVEVNNEPDLKPIPADHYVPLVKAMSYALMEADSPVPLVSGVFASMPPGPFYDTCSANGMLEDSNAVSFHSYDHAPDIEPMVVRFRTWLKNSDKERMPLWHTECGRAWTQGPDRPPQDQDALSALDISAKAAETMACGVSRYFPFVYTFYEEGLKNFAMMGREVTPLRGMAGYAMCIQALSDKKYLGDVQGLDGSVKLARVFGNAASKECVAVLYTGNIDSNGAVTFPVKIKRVMGADGRTLPVSDKGVPVPDGLSYVWMDRSELGGKLKTDTTAMRLYELGQHPLVQKRRASPLVLEFLAQQTPSRPSSRRYLVTQEEAGHLPLNVRVHNLSQAPISFTPELSLPGKPGEKAVPVTVPAMGYSDIAWKLDVTADLDIAQTRFISVSGTSGSGIQPLPLAIPLVMEGTLEQHLKKHQKQAPLKIVDLAKWQPNIAGHGTSKFSITTDGAWREDEKYSGEVGNWSYPKFTLPEKVDPGVYSGFLIRARVFKTASNVAIIAESGEGIPSFWVTNLFPSDGEWHVVYIPFAEFIPGPGGAGNQNTRLDPAAWKELNIGMGSAVSENALEVSHFILVGGSGD